MKYRLRKTGADWSLSFYVRDVMVFNVVSSASVLRELADYIVATLH
jgi:hypothetical protein